MAQETYYICDKCKKKWLSTDKNEQPVAIGLIINFGQFKPTYPSYASFNESAMWCRECIMKAGIKAPYTKEDKKVAPTNPPSTEDILIELFENLGFTRGE